MVFGGGELSPGCPNPAQRFINSPNYAFIKQRYERALFISVQHGGKDYGYETRTQGFP